MTQRCKSDFHKEFIWLGLRNGNLIKVEFVVTIIVPGNDESVFLPHPACYPSA